MLSSDNKNERIMRVEKMSVTKILTTITLIILMMTAIPWLP